MNMENFLKKLSISKIVDILVYNFSLFLILFAWGKFITKNTAVTITLCVVFLSIFNTIYILYKIRHQSRIKEKREKLAEMERKTFSLLLLDDNEIKELLAKRYLAQDKHIKILNNLVILNNNKNEAVGYYFDDRILSLEKGLKIIHSAINRNIKMIKILCFECSEKDKQKMENVEDINVNILTKEKVYFELFSQGNIDIDCKISFNNNKKINFKNFFKIAIKKEKAKKYFASGLIIFFCSLIVRFSIYYVFASSILFLLALISYNEKMFQR